MTSGEQAIETPVPQLAEFSSLVQWAEELGVSRSLAYRWFKEGRIPGAQLVGRDVLVPKETPRPPARKPGRKKIVSSVNAEGKRRGIPTWLEVKG